MPEFDCLEWITIGQGSSTSNCKALLECSTYNELSNSNIGLSVHLLGSLCYCLLSAALCIWNEPIEKLHYAKL